MALARLLFVSDTHLGFDHPFRPRIRRRRRGPDFFANFERALQHARTSRVNGVIHGGDILFRSKVPARLVQMAFAPLKRLAEEGIPVFVVPGNHERSAIPRALLAQHPGLHVFDRPRTYVLELDGIRLALAGFPHVRHNVRSEFVRVVEQTGWRATRADGTLLCMHQAVDGAVVGPSGYVFRYESDVVRASDIPRGFAAVLAGHIHRSQTLGKDLAGKPLAAPVFYPGSIERTSFAEKDEKKGYLTLELETRPGAGCCLAGWHFHELPARPMVQVELKLPFRRRSGGFKDALKKTLHRLPPDGVVKLRVHRPVTAEALAVLRAASLRTLAPPTMNVTVQLLDQDQDPRRGPTSRRARTTHAVRE